MSKCNNCDKPFCKICAALGKGYCFYCNEQDLYIFDPNFIMNYNLKSPCHVLYYEDDNHYYFSFTHFCVNCENLITDIKNYPYCGTCALGKKNFYFF